MVTGTRTAGEQGVTAGGVVGYVAQTVLSAAYAVCTFGDGPVGVRVDATRASAR